MRALQTIWNAEAYATTSKIHALMANHFALMKIKCIAAHQHILILALPAALAFRRVNIAMEGLYTTAKAKSGYVLTKALLVHALEVI